MGIAVEFFGIEVGVRGYEIKHIILRLPEPVFPALVPAFHKHLVETVFGGKVDVSFHIFGVGRVLAVGLGLGVVGFAEFHRVNVVGVGPAATPGNHVPPHAYVFHRLYPRSVGVFARLVEVERHARGKYVASIVADDDGAPRRLAGRLHISFLALSVGSEPRLEYHGLVVEVEAHARIIDECCLVQVDIQAVVGFHHQCRLYAGWREHRLRRVGCHGSLHKVANFAQAALGVVIFLGVVVARNPVCGVVSGHCELCVFLLDGEIHKVLLLRELVAKSHAFVVNAETYYDVAVEYRLRECHGHFVVVVADYALFAPYGNPVFIERRAFGVCQLETVHEREFVGLAAGEVERLERVAHTHVVKFQAQSAFEDYGLLLVVHAVNGPPVFYIEINHYLAIGRRNSFGSLQIYCLHGWHQ